MPMRRSSYLTKSSSQRWAFGLLAIFVTFVSGAQMTFATAGFGDFGQSRTVWIGDNYVLLYVPWPADGTFHYPSNLSLWKAHKAGVGEIAMENDVILEKIIVNDVTGII